MKKLSDSVTESFNGASASVWKRIADSTLTDYDKNGTALIPGDFVQVDIRKDMKAYDIPEQVICAWTGSGVALKKDRHSVSFLQFCSIVNTDELESVEIKFKKEIEGLRKIYSKENRNGKDRFSGFLRSFHMMTYIEKNKVHVKFLNDKYNQVDAVLKAKAEKIAQQHGIIVAGDFDLTKK